MKKLLVLGLFAALVGAGTSAAFAKPNCYSARHCGGKIINHKDEHNCKNSGGKSWRPAPGADCRSW